MVEKGDDNDEEETNGGSFAGDASGGRGAKLDNDMDRLLDVDVLSLSLSDPLTTRRTTHTQHEQHRATNAINTQQATKPTFGWSFIVASLVFLLTFAILVIIRSLALLLLLFFTRIRFPLVSALLFARSTRTPLLFLCLFFFVTVCLSVSLSVLLLLVFAGL